MMQIEKRIPRNPPVLGRDNYCGRESCDLCFVSVFYNVGYTDEEYAEWLTAELEADKVALEIEPIKTSDDGFLRGILQACSVGVSTFEERVGFAGRS